MISRVRQSLGFLGVLLLLSGCNKKIPVETLEHEPSIPFKPPLEFVPGPQLTKMDRNKPEFMLAWCRFTTVDDYRRAGRTHPAWDDSAIAALGHYAKLVSLGARGGDVGAIQDEIIEETKKAVAAGCDDPLIRYFHVRYIVSREPNISKGRLAEAFGSCADSIEKTDYSPIRKAYLNVRAAEATLSVATGKPTDIDKALRRYRRAAAHHLNAALHDTQIPPSEAATITKMTWEAVKANSIGTYDFLGLLFPTFDKLWSDHAFGYYIKGRYYIDKAWRERGGGVASSVNEHGWKGFKENLERAQLHLERGWKIDPTDPDIPTAMIAVCMGSGHPRPQMEKWFARAMKLDPQSERAVRAKALYLEPKWHGSEQELLAFGRECVTNRAWRGNIPLMLSHVHEVLQNHYKLTKEEYGNRPEVWPDLRSSYERFFEINPTDTSWRHNYAWDAYRCGKYQVFLDQLPQFTDGTNYNWWGGKAAFDAYVEKALAATKN